MQLTRGLDRFFDHPIVFRPRRLPPGTIAVLGWGLKGKSLQARSFAQRNGLPYLAVEDGFLRSVSLGDTDPPLSIVLDDEGIYYDATSPSRLERLIASSCPPAAQKRAAVIQALWRSGRISKYNFAREAPVGQEDYVLAVDQTMGDASIKFGLADDRSFHRMLEAALDEHPGATVVLKVHPDVLTGRKQAHFSPLTPAAASRVLLLATNSHVPAVLEHARAVYTVTSQVGFEALLWNRPVRTFGMPFYAGWGLTRDELATPPGRKAAGPVTLERLIHAALVEYPRYVDPETSERCEVERVIEWMALQRRMRERFPAKLQAIGFSNWKKPIARLFFAGSELDFIDSSSADPAPKDEAGPAIAMWGRERSDSKHSFTHSQAVLRVEDGFLRSVGLGAHWVRPLSWVIDSTGMYYDARASSQLEAILQSAVFDEVILDRARRLREAIVAAGITKYNQRGAGRFRRPPSDRRVILVPGQVEGDASITYGAPGVNTNLGLLQAVRRAVPDAYVIYKPHPDVLARKRVRGAGEALVHEYCDEVIDAAPIHHLLQQVDEVHVMTSLAGFEALLRSRAVVCHGQPFYSGWGLTTDIVPHPRRTRRLSLDQLAAATLILYPTYVSRTTDAFTTPERALYELAHWDNVRPGREPAWLAVLRLVKRYRDRYRARFPALRLRN